MQKYLAIVKISVKLQIDSTITGFLTIFIY